MNVYTAINSPTLSIRCQSVVNFPLKKLLQDEPQPYNGGRVRRYRRLYSRIATPRVRPICRIICRFAWQLWRDFGDIPADSLDFLLLSVPFHVQQDGLRCEHYGAQQMGAPG